MWRMKQTFIALLAFCFCLAGCGGKETNKESSDDDGFSNPQDDNSVSRQAEETATPFETIELKYLGGPDARYAVPKGEKWKLIWNRPPEYGRVTPSYDVRFTGAIVLGNDQTIAVSGVTSGVSESSFNVLALSKREQSVIVWAYEGAGFYSANEYIKVRIEKYKIE